MLVLVLVLALALALALVLALVLALALALALARGAYSIAPVKARAYRPEKRRPTAGGRSPADTPP